MREEVQIIISAKEKVDNHYTAMLKESQHFALYSLSFLLIRYFGYIP